jgi:hypothetical protein
MKTKLEEAASKYVEEWHIDMGWVPTERSCIPSVASFIAGAEFMQKQIETEERAYEIRVNWESDEFQEATHYNWLDNENEKLKEANHTLALALADCKKYNGDITKIDEIIREALKKISE